MSDFPNRFNLSLTQEAAFDLAVASDIRNKSNPYILREVVEDGLTTWLDAQDPLTVKKARKRVTAAQAPKENSDE